VVAAADTYTNTKSAVKTKDETVPYQFKMPKEPLQSGSKSGILTTKIMQSNFVRKVSSICMYVRFEVPLTVNI
jgi:hypothetical protein